MQVRTSASMALARTADPSSPNRSIRRVLLWPGMGHLATTTMEAGILIPVRTVVYCLVFVRWLLLCSSPTRGSSVRIPGHIFARRAGVAQTCRTMGVRFQSYSFYWIFHSSSFLTENATNGHKTRPTSTKRKRQTTTKGAPSLHAYKRREFIQNNVPGWRSSDSTWVARSF